MSDTGSTDQARRPPAPPAGGAPGLGLSAVELAARRGIGPLSPLGAQAWHGEAKPCVSCGQLVRRTASACDQCGQDLNPQMLIKMEAHCGPWYVLEHVRPFPGVTLERLIRQAKRGVLTATTIIRGPTTYHQWRFAGETPALSKYLGMCWRCQAAVTERDPSCPICRVHLDGETDVLIEQALPQAAASAPAQPAVAHPAPAVATRSAPGGAGQDELRRLSAALNSPGGIAGVKRVAAPATVAGIPVQWVVVGLVAVLVVVIYVVVRIRANHRGAPDAKARPASPVALANRVGGAHDSAQDLLSEIFSAPTS